MPAGRGFLPRMAARRDLHDNSAVFDRARNCPIDGPAQSDAALQINFQLDGDAWLRNDLMRLAKPCGTRAIKSDDRDNLRAFCQTARGYHAELGSHPEIRC